MSEIKNESVKYEPLFELLKADDIECRAEAIDVNIKICLHVKASTCTRLLNQTVGPMNWEKTYTNNNKNCVVSIWDEKKQRMISKEDCGGGLTELDGYKGQASNGFKRACSIGWGLGIELYSQPLIMIPLSSENVVYGANGSIISESYTVKEIEYNEEERKITRVVIQDSTNKVVYDGPDENGQNRVIPQLDEEDDEEVIIPENADILNSEEDQDVEPCDIDLPDNTDGMPNMDEEENDDMNKPENEPYSELIAKEVQRTHVRPMDVLKSMNARSFEEIDIIAEKNLKLVNGVLKRLRDKPTYHKK